MNDIAKMIIEYGCAFAVLGYFVYKDNKFTSRVMELIGKVETLLSQLTDTNDNPKK